MEELIMAVVAAPIVSLLVLGGLVFLFVAIVGDIQGKFTPGRTGRILGGTLGFLLLTSGIVMAYLPPPSREYRRPSLADAKNTTETKNAEAAIAQAGELSHQREDAELVAAAAAAKRVLAEKLLKAAQDEAAAQQAREELKRLTRQQQQAELDVRVKAEQEKKATQHASVLTADAMSQAPFPPNGKPIAQCPLNSNPEENGETAKFLYAICNGSQGLYYSGFSKSLGKGIIVKHMDGDPLNVFRNKNYTYQISTRDGQKYLEAYKDGLLLISQIIIQ